MAIPALAAPAAFTCIEYDALPVVESSVVEPPVVEAPAPLEPEHSALYDFAGRLVPPELHDLFRAIHGDVNASRMFNIRPHSKD